MAQLSEQDYEEMLDELYDAQSVQEMFDIFSDYYDLDNCTPGSIVKDQLIKNLGKAIKVLRPQPR